VIKFLVILCLLLILVCMGEYWYFTRRNVQWSRSMDQWREEVETAQKEVKTAQKKLSNCQARPDATILAKQVAACRVSCPQVFVQEMSVPLVDPTPLPAAEYQSWPKFLRPNKRGEIQIIKKYFISIIVDLNAFKIISYGTPHWNDREKLWQIDVLAHVRSYDGKYRVNTFHFGFTKAGEIYEVGQTVSE
jgi:hypothetical protein